MLRWTGRSGDHDATMHDVSMHGCFLNTRGDAEVGESISFTTALPTGDPVKLTGRVVHKQHPKLYGFGVKFEDLADKERMYLKLLIADAEQS
jgi:hypothetical protein